MTVRSVGNVLLVVLGLIGVTEVRGQDPGVQNQTYRDMFAGGVSEGHRKFSLWSTNVFDWHTNPTGGTISHVADDVLESWERNHTQLKNVANAAMDHKVVRFLGAEMLFASSYGTVGGHLYEGNLQSAGVAALDELAKNGAAYVGAKAVGGLGATYGFAVAGPPGMLVGGLVGAIGGAAAAVWGYNTALSPTLTGTYEKILEPDREYYINLARRNRQEFLVLEATRKLEAQLARDPLFLRPLDRQNVDYVMRHTPGLQPPSAETSDVPKLSAPGADNPDRWDDLEARAKRMAKETTENPKPEQAEDPETIPVIPDVAVIDAVFTISDFSIRWSFYVRSGTVKGIMVPFVSPQANNDLNTVSAGTWTASIEGTIKDNVISGKMSHEPVKFIQKGTDPAAPWVRELTYNIGAQDVTITFLPGGAISYSEQGGTYTISGIDTAGENAGKTFQVTHPNTPQTMSGVWQYRQAPADAQLRRAPEDSK